MNQFLSALLAQLVERVFKNKLTTAAGVIGGLATVLGAFTTVVSPKYQQLVIGGGALLASVAAVLAKDGTK
jgi:uncharacterized membrane protein